MKNIKISTVHLINPNAAGLLCNFILRGKIMPPYRPRLLCNKQQQQKAKSKKEIKKQILSVFIELEKLISFHGIKDIKVKVGSSFIFDPPRRAKKEWLNIIQNINALPKLVDVSLILSSFGAEAYDKQIRNFYADKRGAYTFYSFVNTFAEEVNMGYIVHAFVDEFLRGDKINRLVRTTMFFLCDLWVCCSFGLHDITKLAYYRHSL